MFKCSKNCFLYVHVVKLHDFKEILQGEANLLNVKRYILVVNDVVKSVQFNLITIKFS